jgi:queuine tRNA-ribosyltransferase
MKNEAFKFEIQGKGGKARAGVFSTPHGDIPTPVFAPVGRQPSNL